MKHLSDQDLQEYFDSSIGIERAEIEEHLQTCAACRRSHDAYRQLYFALSEAPAAQLSTQFSDTIIAKISSETKRISQTVEWILFAVSAIIGVMIMIFILASNVTGNQIVEFLSPIQNLVPISDMTKMLADYDLNLFLFALVVLAAVAILDKFIQKSRLKRSFSQI